MYSTILESPDQHFGGWRTATADALVPAVDASAVAVPVAFVLIVAGDASAVATVAVTLVLFVGLGIVLCASKARRLRFKFWMMWLCWPSSAPAWARSQSLSKKPRMISTWIVMFVDNCRSAELHEQRCNNHGIAVIPRT